ncbi:MAG: hypothetical protein KAR54_01360 [Candidatus Pacebacteria bacterium]|nr:hypothetical protein [Candidatus Paceibacterota bacterium]
MIPYSISNASDEVIKIFDKNPNDEYLFFTESIGTEIALLAIENGNIQKIKGIIAICPVNKPRKISDFPIFCFCSGSDFFARFSNKMLWPLQMFNSTKGRIEVLNLDNIRHDQFVPNYRLNGNQTLFQLIKEKIDNF